MIVIKKDFVPEDTESYCNKRVLSSGKAYFLQDNFGNIHYAGKQCAEQYSNTNLSLIPDLTKSLISNKEGSHSGGGSSAGGSSTVDNSEAVAITYILLREEKLNDFQFGEKSLSYTVLKSYYEKYTLDKKLETKDVQHILNIEKKAPVSLSLKNLSTCYAYQFILERTLNYLRINDNKKGIIFIDGLIEYLKKNCKLSIKQIEGLNNWLQYLPQDLRESKLKSFS
jgi:hypothetical protein